MRSGENLEGGVVEVSEDLDKEFGGEGEEARGGRHCRGSGFG